MSGPMYGVLKKPGSSSFLHFPFLPMLWVGNSGRQCWSPAVVASSGRQ